MDTLLCLSVLWIFIGRFCHMSSEQDDDDDDDDNIY